MKRIVLALLLSTQLCFAQYQPTAKGELIEHTNYSLDYCEEHEQPHWVYYKLTPDHFTGAAERSDNFRSDPKVSTGSAVAADYTNSGYDRGHLCPAGDMSSSDLAMSETFYMSNMSPQAPNLNRGGWKSLEELVRMWAISEQELHIAVGGVLSTGLERIGSNGVSVPQYYYKVIYAPKSEKMIAFLMPNEKLTKSIEEYTTTVDEVERIIGVDLFYQIEDGLESQLESSINSDKWSFTLVKTATQSSTSTKTTTQCQGVTSSGKQCSRSASAGSAYCWQHQEQQ